MRGLAVAVLLVVSLPSSAGVPRLSTIEVPVVVITAAADIESDDPPLTTFRCSGFAVSATQVATAAHCISGDLTRLSVAAGGTDICTGSWTYARAQRVVVFDEDADLAILEMGQTIAASVASVRVQEGRLVAVGWQQSSRQGPFQCDLQTAVLSPAFCPASVADGRACFRTTTGRLDGSVCSGLSGAPIVSHRRAVALIATSDGCGAALVEGPTLP